MVCVHTHYTPPCNANHRAKQISVKLRGTVQAKCKSNGARVQPKMIRILSPPVRPNCSKAEITKRKFLNFGFRIRISIYVRPIFGI